MSTERSTSDLMAIIPDLVCPRCFSSTSTGSGKMHQAVSDRFELAKFLNISDTQLSYGTMINIQVDIIALRTPKPALYYHIVDPLQETL